MLGGVPLGRLLRRWLHRATDRIDLSCVRRRAYDRTKLEVAISIVVLCVSVAATFLGFGQQVVGLVRAYINGSDDDRR